jgi:transcriptional regulator with GAF, ATPase, and Fis domain
MAHGGSMLLDEVGELLGVQGKLLRVWREDVERLGSPGRSRWTCG